jgi:endonuclease YncB( thermonuclease family)
LRVVLAFSVGSKDAIVVLASWAVGSTVSSDGRAPTGDTSTVPDRNSNMATEPTAGGSGRRKPRSPLAAGVVLVLALAACGGAVAQATAPTATTAVTTGAPATAAPTTSAPTAAPVTEPPVSEPPVAAAPVTEPPTTTAPAITIANVVDGDTVDLSTGERVRVIGIDTPERGQCGFQEASDEMATLALDKVVVVTPGARDDVDKYGRILRYLDVDGSDVGLRLIRDGLAIARYDSRDGYGAHTREAAYIAADDAIGSICAAATPASTPSTAATAAPPASGSTYYANCDAARAGGAAPLHTGDPGYRTGLDRDHDGTACE